MEEKVVTHNRMKDLLIMGLTVVVSVFWILCRSIPIYESIVVGAIFEILWLPMLLLLFGIPIVSLFFWYKEKWRLKTVYPFCMLVMTFIGLLLIFC